MALIVFSGLLLGCRLALADSESAMYFVHSDHLGTPQQLTNEAATVVWAADYEPFGKVSLQRATVSNSVRFSGQYHDSESALHYNYLRDYDPTIARFTQSDPIGTFDGLNTYAYVHSNPIRNTDRFGLFSFDGVIEEMSADMYPVIDEETGAIIGLDSFSRINRCRRRALARCKDACFGTAIAKELLGASLQEVAKGMAEDVSSTTAKLALKATIKNTTRVLTIFTVVDLERCVSECVEDPAITNPPECRPGCLLRNE